MRFALSRVFTIFAVACTGAVAQDDVTTYQVGVSSIEITPSYPVRLNGFGFRRDEAEGTSLKLWAKALAISNADEPPLVLIAIDNLGIRQTMVDAVAKELQAKYQIPRENVALTFTHTHCGPKVNGASDTIFCSAIPPDQQAHIDRYSAELPKFLIQVAEPGHRTTPAREDRMERRSGWLCGESANSGWTGRSRFAGDGHQRLRRPAVCRLHQLRLPLRDVVVQPVQRRLGRIRARGN